MVKITKIRYSELKTAKKYALPLREAPIPISYKTKTMRPSCHLIPQTTDGR